MVDSFVSTHSRAVLVAGSMPRLLVIYVGISGSIVALIYRSNRAPASVSASALKGKYRWRKRAMVSRKVL